jgi:hypothetical protein
MIYNRQRLNTLLPFSNFVCACECESECVMNYDRHP